MLEKIPSPEEINLLIGPDKFKAWNDICSMIDGLYDMEHQWNSGGKAWKYEYKYRRGGKTLCALYARDNCAGFMIIFGKDEREKFEGNRRNYSEEVRQIYDMAKTYHDGKWIMFELNDASMPEDFKKLLATKRKPNRK
ncbi:MAG: DUF3788 domain-containing protein [Lachnospiraceae bacterium]|nr:DUF3788 domain-containing protein [Lachnospiraceae bacterium]